MLPITLDLKRIRVLLAGEGPLARRRLALLDEADPGEVEVSAPDPKPGLAHAAGSRLRLRWPEAKDIARAQFVFLAAVPEPIATRMNRIANTSGVLLNIEDSPTRSDFHSAAVIRRGAAAAPGGAIWPGMTGSARPSSRSAGGLAISRHWSRHGRMPDDNVADHRDAKSLTHFRDAGSAAIARRELGKFREVPYGSL